MVVLDASAVLAYLQQEPGMEAVRKVLEAGDAIISTVNLAEVAAKVKGRGVAPELVVERLKALGLRFEAFSEADAIASGQLLYPVTQAFGLSLGDRACLAVSRRLQAKALTAEKTWKKIELDIEIDLMR